MAVNIFQRLLLRFKCFNSSAAPNASLRGLNRKDGLSKVEQYRQELLGSYVKGEISGFQCRVLLNDYIRDSIHILDEVDLIERYQDDITESTFRRQAAPEDSEVEKCMISLTHQFRAGRITTAWFHGSFERLTEKMPLDRRCHWRQQFRQRCFALRLPIPDIDEDC